MAVSGETSTFSSSHAIFTDVIDPSVTSSVTTDQSSAVSSNTSSFSIPEGCVLKPVSRFIPWDNEHNLIPKQVDVVINVVFTGVLLPLFFLVSFSANLLNMVVFCKQGLKERINMCIFSLSLVDLLYVAATYGYNSDVLYMFAVGRGKEIGPVGTFYLTNYLAGLTGILNASQIVSSVVALERCLCVTHPLLVKSLMSTKKMAVVMWPFLVIVVAGVFIYGGMRYTVICLYDAGKNSITYSLYTSEFYAKNKEIIHIFGGIIYGLLLPSFCATVVTVCTVITVVKMKKLSQWRRENVSSASDAMSSRDLAVTRMIVGTSVLFIACTVPMIADRVSVVLVPELKVGGRYDNLKSVFIRIYMLTSVINSTFNFFVYYYFGTKFRQTVQGLFASCTCIKKMFHFPKSIQ